MKAKVKSWLRNIESGKLSNFTEAVLKAVKDNTSEQQGISTYELREKMGLAHQTLTSRLSELNDEGLIKVTGQVEIKNRTYSVYTYISNSEEIPLIVLLRRQEKYIQWLKKAESFMDLMGVETLERIQYEQTEQNCY